MPVREAYNHGRYREAEAQARKVVALYAHSSRVPQREQAAQARSVMAYAAARRHNLAAARSQFTLLEQEASSLPDGGKLETRPGEDRPALNQDAAYQHAVCTAALGQPKAAEVEYLAFVRRFPTSPLVSGAIGRIARMHGGNVPKAAEELWQMAEQRTQEQQTQREIHGSSCGPECLAELLRRQGTHAPVAELVKEMRTNAQGTSLEALAQACRKRGLQPQGLALTQKGLTEQTLPVIALLLPGHYVLVEAVSPLGVTVWDPDTFGVGQPKSHPLPLSQWRRCWSGVVLAFSPNTAVRLARR